MKNIIQIKGKHKGQTAFVAGCGPSTKQVDRGLLLKYIEGDTVLCIKQAQKEFADICDYHFINDNNLTKYAYSDKTEIIASSMGKFNFSKYCSKAVSYGINVKGGNNMKNSMCSKKKFELNEFKAAQPTTIWGPGIMYEAVIPFIVHCGFSHIKFIGWDYTLEKGKNKLTHFYNNEPVFRPTLPLKSGETKALIESSSHLYDYLIKNEITSEILSNQSNISEKFPRKSL
jgi:hypothetical protein